MSAINSFTSRWAVGCAAKTMTSTGDATCRSCGLAISRGEQVQHRPFAVEVSHGGCSWLSPEECALLDAIGRGEHVAYSATLKDVVRWGYATDRFACGQRVVALTTKPR